MRFPWLGKGRRQRKRVDPARLTAEQWLPIETIDGDTIRRRDGTLVAAIAVQPINLLLLSEREQHRRIAALHEVLQGVRGSFQVLILPGPLDLDGYLHALEAEARAMADTRRRRILQQYTAYIRDVVQAGAAIERRFYVLISEPGDRPNAASILRERARDLAASLKAAGLEAYVLTDNELIDLCYVWAHPLQAAFERAELPSLLPTVYEGEADSA